MPRPTVHRILVNLSAEGFVDRDQVSGAWRLGPEMYLLGMVAATEYDVTNHARPVLEELARKTGESAFFSARRGSETICLLDVEGSFPLRSHVLREGLRLPLGVASAGLAILSLLPESEIDAYIASAHEKLARNWGPKHDMRQIRNRVALTIRNGYAINPGLLVEGSWGMGAAVFDRAGQPKWALSLTGVEARFEESRRPELGRLLMAAAHSVTRKLSDAR